MYSKIKALMDAGGMSAYKLSKELGLSRSVFSEWKSGKSKPKYETVQLIADYFDVPISYFYDGESDKLGAEHEFWSTKPQPVYDVAAGQGRVNGEYAAEHVSSGASDEHSFIRIHGDSMLPYLQDGDLVKVHNVPDVTPSDFTVIKVDGETATIKYVEFADGGVYLRASNKDVFEDTFYDAREIATLPIKVIGKAVAIVERML